MKWIEKKRSEKYPQQAYPTEMNWSWADDWTEQSGS